MYSYFDILNKIVLTHDIINKVARFVFVLYVPLIYINSKYSRNGVKLPTQDR